MAEHVETGKALAAVYARGLFELSKEQGVVDQIMDEFHDLIDYMRTDAEFARFMNSPTVDEDTRRTVLDKLFRGKMHDLLLNTLLVMNDKGRNTLYAAACRSFEELLEEDRGQVEVHVIVAAPLSERLRAQLTGVMAGRTSRKPIILEAVDSRIIGGLIVQVGDELIDASVVKRLENMRSRLIDRAGREILSGKTYFDNVEVA